MTHPRLPAPFRKALKMHFGEAPYEVLEAYVDSREYRQHQHLPCLRNLLGLNDCDPCADCYMIVKDMNGNEISILLEDKDVTHNRSRAFKAARRSLGHTLDLLDSVDIGHPEVSRLYITSLKLTDPITARQLSGHPTKVLFNNMTGKVVTIGKRRIEVNTV